ncbi:hypothetical protein [Mycobacterium kyorinense]|uniref:hypothetical protein n=1 Tax=Mycobacterium kyorinense TaxID=487514 RepID=UPI001B8039E0|nr:hypothetical protein [Mycobacterium kyorinense]
MLVTGPVLDQKTPTTSIQRCIRTQIELTTELREALERNGNLAVTDTLAAKRRDRLAEASATLISEAVDLPGCKDCVPIPLLHNDL